MSLNEKVALWIGIIVGSGTILHNIYKYRNLLLIPLKWCKAKCKNIATTYKNIKAKIVDCWNIEALKQQHKEELAQKDKKIDMLENASEKRLSDATAIIRSLCLPPKSAWDFLWDMKDIEDVRGIYQPNCYYITYQPFDEYCIAKILHVDNGNYGKSKGTMETCIQTRTKFTMTIEQILEAHKNNKETLIYEPPLLLPNNR